MYRYTFDYNNNKGVLVPASEDRVIRCLSMNYFDAKKALKTLQSTGTIKTMYAVIRAEDIKQEPCKQCGANTDRRCDECDRPVCEECVNQYYFCQDCSDSIDQNNEYEDDFGWE